jgi:predicted PurR-regulated permease PerM
MSNVDNASVDQRFLANSMASFLQIAAVVLLIFTCYKIVAPFLPVVVWGIIIAVAVYPAHVSLTAKLGGKAKLSSTIIALIGIAIIVIPTWLLADSTIGALKQVGETFQSGTMTVPPPNESVADWPVVGERVYSVWSKAAINLEATVNEFTPQIKAAGERALSLAGHTVVTVFLFIFSIIIAAVLVNFAEDGRNVTRNIAARLVGAERGESLTNLTIQTIRSVVKGVLGVAFIQAIVSGLGMAFAGIPAAGLLAGAVLVLAIVQLPPLIVLGPIAFWYFSVADPTSATIFLIFALIVSGSDTFLKPMFLGRGVEVPMLVILLGAIGGAVTMGIVGLFIGSVVLALGYEILTAWMAPDESSGDAAAAQPQ